MHPIDHDHVAVENLAVQGYWPAELGSPKVVTTGRVWLATNPEIVKTPTAKTQGSSIGG